MTKICPKCNSDKDVGEFYKNKNSKDGLRCWCIECGKNDNKVREHEYSETRKIYRREHKDEYRANKRKYYINNKETILSGNAAWRQTPSGKFGSYIRGAKSRNIEFILTFDEFMKYWQRPCSYCGDDISTIGIDRVNSTYGYIVDNIVSCCSVCNIMKTNMSLDMFINKIEQIYVYNK